MCQGFLQEWAEYDPDSTENDAEGNGGNEDGEISGGIQADANRGEDEEEEAGATGGGLTSVEATEMLNRIKELAEVIKRMTKN